MLGSVTDPPRYRALDLGGRDPRSNMINIHSILESDFLIENGFHNKGGIITKC